MSYVDGFLIAIPKKNLQMYRRIAQKAGKIWKEHGAVQYVESVGDDLDTKMGLSFPQTMKVKPGETIVFSWIVFKSRAHRDRVNSRVMKDQRIADMMKPGSPQPFDIKRMAYGGFKMMVEA